MTVAEIKEMINSTIRTNGNGEVTAQNLNLALNALADALGNAGGGAGSGIEVIYINGADGPSVPDDKKALNALVVAKCKAAYEAGQKIPMIMLDMATYQKFTGEVEVTGYISFVMYAYVPADSVADTPSCIIGYDPASNKQLFIGEDGSLIQIL